MTALHLHSAVPLCDGRRERPDRLARSRRHPSRSAAASLRRFHHILTPAGRRRGFTLLELLVAIAMSGLLIAAVYSGINLYWQYSTAGRDEVERSQIGRAILRRIEVDLRSLVYHKPAAAQSGTSGASSSTSSTATSAASGSNSSGSSGSTGSSTGSSSQTSDVQITSPETASTTTTSGLFGNATTLMMHISHPRRDLAYSTLPQNTGAPASDLAMVAYFVSGSGTGTLQNMLPVQGLARTEGDRMVMSTAEQQSNLQALAARTEILAPEVIGLRFSYFDGVHWRYDWDSTVMGGPPRAVEVLLELAPASASGRAAGSQLPLAQGQSSRIYRLVVALPLGKPMDTSAIQQ